MLKLLYLEPRHSRCRSSPIAVARANVAASSACVAIPLRGGAAKNFRRMVSAATMNLPVNAAELVRRAFPNGPRLSSYSTAALVASSKDRLRWTGDGSTPNFLAIFRTPGRPD